MLPAKRKWGRWPCKMGLFDSPATLECGERLLAYVVFKSRTARCGQSDTPKREPFLLRFVICGGNESGGESFVFDPSPLADPLYQTFPVSARTGNCAAGHRRSIARIVIASTSAQTPGCGLSGTFRGR